jgi:hypothetical protein
MKWIGIIKIENEKWITGNEKRRGKGMWGSEWCTEE